MARAGCASAPPRIPQPEPARHVAWPSFAIKKHWRCCSRSRNGPQPQEAGVLLLFCRTKTPRAPAHHFLTHHFAITIITLPGASGGRADTSDLKSGGSKEPCGFESRLAHELSRYTAWTDVHTIPCETPARPRALVTDFAAAIAASGVSGHHLDNVLLLLTTFSALSCLDLRRAAAPLLPVLVAVLEVAARAG